MNCFSCFKKIIKKRRDNNIYEHLTDQESLSYDESDYIRRTILDDNSNTKEVSNTLNQTNSNSKMSIYDDEFIKTY